MINQLNKENDLKKLRFLFTHLIIALTISCSERKETSQNDTKKADLKLLSKYSSLLNRYKNDTVLILDAFRYIKVDTTIFKKILIKLPYRTEGYFRQKDLDSILQVDYGIWTVHISDYKLYSKLFSLKYPDEVKDDVKLSSYYFELPGVVKYIKDSLLRLPDKEPFEAYRKARTIVYERVNKHRLDKIKHLDIFLFDQLSLDLSEFYAVKSNNYVWDIRRALSKYQKIMLETFPGRNDVYPIRIKFDTAGVFQSVTINGKVDGPLKKRFEDSIRENDEHIRIRLINNKPLTYDFVSKSERF